MSKFHVFDCPDNDKVFVDLEKIIGFSMLLKKSENYFGLILSDGECCILSNIDELKNLLKDNKFIIVTNHENNIIYLKKDIIKGIFFNNEENRTHIYIERDAKGLAKLLGEGGPNICCTTPFDEVIAQMQQD